MDRSKISLAFLSSGWGFPAGSVVKNLPGNKGDPGLIPGSDHLRKELATHSSILAWRRQWTEESGGYSPWDHKRVGHDLATQQC